MGSGKSTLGKKLARHFDFDFVDVDEEIEAQEKLSINEIFETKGEDYFRKKESEVLRNIQGENAFISTGGGCACHSENIDFMKKNGIVLYLKHPAELLLGRLKQNKAERPLIKDLSDNELKEYIDDKLEERNPFYEQADITFAHNKSLVLIKSELNFVIQMSDTEI